MPRRSARARRAFVLGTLVVACMSGCRPTRSRAEPVPVPPAPRGHHPRLGLSAPVLATLKKKARVVGTAAADAVAACKKAAPAPGLPDGYQGNDWAFGASSCALAYQLTGNKAFALKGVAFWRALLEDVDKMGDGQACVRGADPDHAIASVRRDTGYALRFVGPHAALAYDWLHDAPGVDEALRKQSRACFGAWLDWYTKDGYLRAQPGANYHAGFVLTKTLMAIALAGEAGPAGERYWRETVADVFGAQLVANGLAGDHDGRPTGGRRGVLVGGDWAEGWQYGGLSVIEYAWAARALEEAGAREPALDAWADSVTVRYLHGLLPARDGMYVGGDTEAERPYLDVTPGPLVATILGPSSDRAAGWAAFLADALGGRRYGVPVIDALAEARTVVPADPLATARPPWYLARGTRTLYARSAWTSSAFWAAFTSSPRQVSDHQHVDATNFVFSRGPDALVVDPAPYGSRSTLSGNALTIDSDVVKRDYKPSQTPWSLAELPWARATRSGVVAARGDIARAFDFNGDLSDVPLARRDWVFLPEGELVVIDRAETGGDRRAAYIRFRSPAPFTPVPAGAGAPFARAEVGASALAVHAVVLSPAGAPALAAIPKKDDCPGSFGSCAIARFPVGEYAVKLKGARVLAVHVLDGLARGEAPARALRLDDASIDPASAASPRYNADVVGAAVQRGGAWTFVVAAAETSDEPPRSLSYGVPGGAAGRHVVFDAPDDGHGRVAVSAVASGGRCVVTLSSSGTATIAGRPAVFTVGLAAAGCPVTEDPDVPSDGAQGDAR